MKIKNIFKNEKKSISKIQSLDKTQLEKVIGGTSGLGGGAASASYAATGFSVADDTTTNPRQTQSSTFGE